MKRYVKLVNFEFNRIAKLYSILLAIVIVSQITGLILQSRRYLRMASEVMKKEMVSQKQFLLEHGHLSLVDIIQSYWFIGPIMLCIVAVAFYIFIIWYRDWFGKNTFIYRLLMLPTSRLTVFWAKLTTIMLATFGFVGLQLILLPVESMIFKWMVPIDFRLDKAIREVIYSVHELIILMPPFVEQFILYYGTGMIVVTVIFTAIILERCFRWKGIFGGVIYGMAMMVVFYAPILIQEMFLGTDFFYPVELLGLEVLTGLLVFTVSVWFSGWLLKNKIRV